MGRVIKICRACRGAGWRMVSVKPIAFKACSKCKGNRGRCAPSNDGRAA